jgi:hypothetical protein
MRGKLIPPRQGAGAIRAPDHEGKLRAPDHEGELRAPDHEGVRRAGDQEGAFRIPGYEGELLAPDHERTFRGSDQEDVPVVQYLERPVSDAPDGTGAPDSKRMLGIVAVTALAMISATATLAFLPAGILIHTGRVSAVHPLAFFGDGHLRVRTALFGVVFVAWISIALAVTRTWHRFRPERRTAVQGAVAVALGQTVILLLAAALTGVKLRLGLWAAPIYLAVSELASLSGAYLLSRATMFVTGRSEPLLSRMMFLWAAGLVAVQLLVEDARTDAAASGALLGGARMARALAPAMVLAWQLPLGLAVAVWFARTRSVPASKIRTLADAARLWVKATVLVGSALLLLSLAIMALDRVRVPVNETDVIEQTPKEFELGNE